MATRRRERGIAIIPARGGSKRLPGKNVRPIAGLPLIAWTIKAAREARLVDRVVLSSDDPEIMSVAAEHGCDVPFIRPKELSTDEATTADAVAHAVEVLGIEGAPVVILQPTSPLRLASDIDAALRRILDGEGDAVVSVTELPKPRSFYALVRENTISDVGRVFPEDADNRPVLVNGAIYIVDAAHVVRERSVYGTKTVAHVMPFERSIDIDTADDFALAEALMPLTWERPRRAG